MLARGGLGTMRTRGNAPATFDFTGGVLPGGAALQRSSAGTRVNAAGVLVSEAIDAPRFDYHPLSHAPLGLLCEGQRTNVVVRSAEFDNAAWSKASLGVALPVVTANAATGPDGMASADRIDFAPVPASGQFAVIASASPIAVAATAQAASVWLRGLAGGEVLYLMVTPDGVSYFRQAVTLVTTWRRFVLAFTPSAGNLYLQIGIDRRDAAQTATAGASVLAWGAQLEAAATPGSDIATGASAVTRAADVLTLAWATRGVRDGVVTLRYSFDDGSTQDVATTVAAGVSTVPTTLNRAQLRRVALV